ncbi:MAG: TRAP transporter large permease subunit [Desulfotignum sp.]|nr:TRAP transporter large permease subunit [Desulfotignum sp.]
MSLPWVIGGIFIGLFTPTEAAAIGAFGVLLIAVIRRQISGRVCQIPYGNPADILHGACARLPGRLFSANFWLSSYPFEIAGWVSALPISPVMVLGVILLIYLFGGCFMDAWHSLP